MVSTGETSATPQESRALPHHPRARVRRARPAWGRGPRPESCTTWGLRPWAVGRRRHVKPLGSAAHEEHLQGPEGAAAEVLQLALCRRLASLGFAHLGLRSTLRAPHGPDLGLCLAPLQLCCPEDRSARQLLPPGSIEGCTGRCDRRRTLGGSRAARRHDRLEVRDAPRVVGLQLLEHREIKGAASLRPLACCHGEGLCKGLLQAHCVMQGAQCVDMRPRI
mmetsp:Transcript_46698/g.149114  ORF Transcript_46698/g.149114 Transcript_46698/m.149114 type:complete len:221 (+) Transcript_46698:159-821(+)